MINLNLTYHIYLLENDIRIIGCLVPKMIHPFEPMFRYLRCKLGLDGDEYMEAAQCNEISCDESLEEKVITNSRPAPMIMMDLDVQTMSDCFGEMREIQYGARVLAKIVRDASCDDPQYQQICKELMNENRVIEEDGCRTRRYVKSDLFEENQLNYRKSVSNLISISHYFIFQLHRSRR